MLVRVTWRRCPGAQEMPTLLPVIMRPHMLAQIALEDNPCGLRYYCCIHLSKFLSQEKPPFLGFSV